MSVRDDGRFLAQKMTTICWGLSNCMNVASKAGDVSSQYVEMIIKQKRWPAWCLWYQRLDNVIMGGTMRRHDGQFD